MAFVLLLFQIWHHDVMQAVVSKQCASETFGLTIIKLIHIRCGSVISRPFNITSVLLNNKRQSPQFQSIDIHIAIYRGIIFRSSITPPPKNGFIVHLSDCERSLITRGTKHQTNVLKWSWRDFWLTVEVSQVASLL